MTGSISAALLNSVKGLYDDANVGKNVLIDYTGKIKSFGTFLVFPTDLAFMHKTRTNFTENMKILVLHLPIMLTNTIHMKILMDRLGEINWEGTLVLIDIKSIVTQDWIRTMPAVPNLLIDEVTDIEGVDKYFKIVWNKIKYASVGKELHVH